MKGGKIGKSIWLAAALCSAAAAGCGMSGGGRQQEAAGTITVDQKTLCGQLPSEKIEQQAESGEQMEETAGLSWERAEAIEAAVQEPWFPNYTVDIQDYGAKPDDGIQDTQAIRQAIEEVSRMGGGTVRVPSGVFDTGAIELKTGVNLCLAEPDSVLRFSREITSENYPLVLAYYEGSACYNWSPLIYAYQQDRIAVTGPGRLDGQADENTWWGWYGNVGVGKDFSRPASSDADLLQKMNEEGVEVQKRVFGEGHYLRTNFVQLIECRNVLIEDVTIENSPMWGINPVLCTSVTVRGVTVRGQWNNNDGCNPENSRLVLIENCRFETGGDGISIKSGRGRDGRVLREQGASSRDILIRNNEFCTGTSGIAFGSEMSGDIQDVYADQNQFGTEALDYGIRFKSNADRGGTVQRIYIRNSHMEHIRDVALHGTVYYGDGWDGKRLPEFRDIRIEGMEGSGGEYGISMEAFQELPLKNLQLIHIRLNGVKHDVRAVHWSQPVIEDVEINGKSYPRPMNVRVAGELVSGSLVEGLAEIPGGDETRLSYEWYWRAEEEEERHFVGGQKMLEITEQMSDGILQLSIKDEKGNAENSMEYRVLSTEEADSLSSEAEKYVRARGYVTEESMDPDAFVTNRECARILSRLWYVGGTQDFPKIQDVPWEDPDYAVIAGVIEGGYMSVQMEANGEREDMVYSNMTNEKEREQMYFRPDEIITREELGQIALLASGIPYEEMMEVEPQFLDIGEIDPQYRSSVGVSAAFGFVGAKEGRKFMPKDKVTWKELAETIQAISEFNGR